jgi:hypothetical protein
MKIRLAAGSSRDLYQASKSDFVILVLHWFGGIMVFRTWLAEVTLET